MRKNFIALLFAAALVAPNAYGADKTNTTNDPAAFTHVFGGDVAHSSGGLWARFLVFEDWSNPATIFPYESNTVIKHSGALWVALTTPAAAAEPGVDAVWEKITDQTGTGSGASITAGTANPSGGSDGDAYFQVDITTPIPNVTVLWRNATGTWTPYNLPTGAGTVTLSDASPENVAAAGSSGTSADASRSDHVHDAFSTATPANLGTTAVAGIGAFASRSDHVHRGLSDTDPADVGTTASGTRTFASRDDHVHGGVSQTYRGEWSATGVYARGDQVHRSSVYWVRNSNTGGSGGTPGVLIRTGIEL